MGEYVISNQRGMELWRQWIRDGKVNTSKKKFNTTLANLCINAVVGYLLKTQNDFDHQGLSSLPVILKEQMLTKLEVAYKNRMYDNELFVWWNFKEILSELLFNVSRISFSYLGQNPEPTVHELRCGKLEREFKVADQDLFRFITYKCRKSLRVFIHGQDSFRGGVYFENLKKNEGSWTKIVWNSILRLTNLRHLEMNRFLLNNDEFSTLGRTLVNLVHLKCYLLDATWTGISEGLKPLKKLKIFRFKLLSPTCENCKMGRFCAHVQEIHQKCIKEFPQLGVVGDSSLPHSGVEDYFAQLCHSLDENTLFGPRARSQLQQLVLRKTITQGQADWHKKITSLRITWDCEEFKDYKPLLSFQNIDSLCLDHRYYLETPVVMRFLQAYGPKLKNLEILVRNSLTVEEILEMCPNLRSLTLVLDRVFQLGPEDGFGRPRFFENLTHLLLDSLHLTRRPDMLIQMFMSSNLRVLLLPELVADGYTLTRALHALQLEKVVAPKLLILQLSPSEEYVDNPSNNVNVDLRHHWRLFLKFVISHAPLLQKLVKRGNFGMDMDDIVFEFRRDGNAGIAQAQHLENFVDFDQTLTTFDEKLRNCKEPKFHWG